MAGSAPAHALRAQAEHAVYGGQLADARVGRTRGAQSLDESAVRSIVRKNWSEKGDGMRDDGKEEDAGRERRGENMDVHSKIKLADG